MFQLYKEGRFFKIVILIPSQSVDFLLSVSEIDIPASNTAIGGTEMWHFERFDHCRSLVNYQDSYTETPRFDRLV